MTTRAQKIYDSLDATGLRDQISILTVYNKGGIYDTDIAYCEKRLERLNPDNAMVSNGELGAAEAFQ